MTAAKWSDLKARVLSSIVMLVVAITSVFLGKGVFAGLLFILVGAMHWELGRMMSPLSRQAQWFSAVCAVITMAILTQVDGPVGQAVTLGIASFLQRSFFMSHGVRGALYSAAIVGSGLFLILLRNDYGIAAVVWLIGVVVVTDICGYFAGRMIGGPKFWPRLSPKKTWSGAVAGWIGAAVLTLGIGSQAGLDLSMGMAIAISVVISFASQMGDIFESGMKRKSNVKDSSNLIPGHGGVLDRFDGIVGASLAFGIMYYWIL